MKHWLRSLLGLDLKPLHDRIASLERELALSQDGIRHEIMLLRNELVVTFNDETSPKRAAMSKELGQRMQKRLEAEKKARDFTVFGHVTATRKEQE